MSDNWIKPEWIKRIDFIYSDIARILDLTKSSVILQEFDQSIAFLDLYIGEMANLARVTKYFIGYQLYHYKTNEEMDAYKSFVDKQSNVVLELKNAIEIVEKRKQIIEKIAYNLSKRKNNSETKKMPKVVYPKSSLTNNNNNNNSKRIVIDNSFEENKTKNNTIAELQKNIEKMTKERDKQNKKITKEREKWEKLLAKEREKSSFI